MSDNYTPWQPPTPKPITVEQAYRGGKHPNPGERIHSLEYGLCVATNEFRPPNDSELFWHDVYQRVYAAMGNWERPRIIMRPVKTIQVPQIMRVLPGRVAYEGDWVISMVDSHPCVSRMLGPYALCVNEHIVEVELAEMEVPE